MVWVLFRNSSLRIHVKPSNPLDALSESLMTSLPPSRDALMSPSSKHPPSSM